MSFTGLKRDAQIAGGDVFPQASDSSDNINQADHQVCKFLFTDFTQRTSMTNSAFSFTGK